MVGFILRKIAQSLVALFLLVSTTFFILRLLPGGPFDTEMVLAPEVRQQMELKFHLDEPILNQYWQYLKSFSQGNLGVSYQFMDQNVGDLILESLPVTLKLGSLALVISIVLGIPLGLLAAQNHNTWRDRFCMAVATVGVSMPTFLIAPLLIVVFSFWFDLLPPALWESPKYYILPVLTLGMRPMAMIARLVRSVALDVFSSDFVRTARAKGVTENQILFRHVFKNSLIPLFGISGPLIANIFSGSFVVEILFAIPGLGHYFIESVMDRDYPMVMALTLLYGVLLMGSNLIVDLGSIIVDRRLIEET